MNISGILEDIRTPWIIHVIDSMAGGVDLRDNFQEQLERFYDLLCLSVETGDPTRVEPILRDWSLSLTQSDIREGEKNISAILLQMMMVSYEEARENLTDREAFEYIGAILPIFTNALEKAGRYEMDTRAAFISNDLAEIQGKFERLDHSKSNFISVAAHELKTPLTLIEGYTEMINEIAKGNSNNQMDSLIDGINIGIHRLQTIVDDMIDVSRIDNNLLALNFQPLWLNKLFTLVRHELAASFTTRHQTLELKPFPGSDLMIFGDSERLYQAFRNILNNAIKYTPDKGNITVDGRILPGYIEITITDTGIGISPEDQEIIFDKFGQLGKAAFHSSGKTKFKGGGPGLGLPIARGIIEAHGGAIWVESPGHDENIYPGSTFHILLPIHTESPDPKLSKLFNGVKKTGQ
jgi:signal transduction histidine kinase